MRAVLILLAGVFWLAALAGTVAFTGYATWLALRGRRQGAPVGGCPFGRAVVVVSAAYAVVMAVCAAALAALVLNGPEPGSTGDALRWAAVPSWSAAAATATLLLQLRCLRRSA